jgi:hypothetical protein
MRTRRNRPNSPPFFELVGCPLLIRGNYVLWLLLTNQQDAMGKPSPDHCYLLAQSLKKAHFLQLGRLTVHDPLIRVALLSNGKGLT